MNIDAEFLFDALADGGSKGDDVVRRGVIGINDNKRLFGPYLRAAKRLAFPSALLDEPSRRDLNKPTPILSLKGREMRHVGILLQKFVCFLFGHERIHKERTC